MGTRGGFLRNDNLAQIVKENFIPVALNLQVESTREDAAGDFFRRINKVQAGESIVTYFTPASGRIHAMTADGKFFNCGGRACRDCSPQAALTAWNKLPESQRRPGAMQVGDLG